MFGQTIADGVLFEIRYARSLAKPVKFFSIENRAEAIRPLQPDSLHFEKAVYAATKGKRDDLLRAIMGASYGQQQLFDVDALGNGRPSAAHNGQFERDVHHPVESAAVPPLSGP